MNGITRNRHETVTRQDRKSPFFIIGSEISRVFLPIMGPECFTIYSYLVSCKFKNPELEHTILELKNAAGMGASTVSRSLEIIERLKLIQLIRRGGSQRSRCKLLDSEKAAELLGATYQKSTLSWLLPEQARQRIEAEVEAIRQRQQGKNASRVLMPCGNRPVRVSLRNAGVSPERRQRATRETQTGTHLIREEVRNKEVPTPTPTPNHDSEAQEGKSSPDEDEPDGLLKSATDAFNGAMNGLGDYLFDTDRPPLPHLANGAAEWDRFGFDSLAVDAAARRGESLVLTLGADDPAAARRGLKKYCRRWEMLLLEWYGCRVRCEIQRTTRTW